MPLIGDLALQQDSASLAGTSNLPERTEVSARILGRETGPRIRPRRVCRISRRSFLPAPQRETVL